MPLAECQVQVRDLIMGPGTNYRILRGFNPFIRQARADQTGARAWNHGTWSGVEWMDQAVVPLYIRVDGGSIAGWVAAHQQLMAAFAPVGEAAADVEMRFELGGTEYIMFGRPRMVEPNLELISTGRSVTQAAFVAPDPHIYSGTETVLGPTGLPTFIGGLTVPFTVPFVIDAVPDQGFLDLTNTGTAETGFLIRIDGPVREPRVALVRADASVQVLRFGFDLLAGQWVDVDTTARTVSIDGTVNRRGQTSGDFPTLPPGGPHRLEFRAAEHNAEATVQASFRSAWY